MMREIEADGYITREIDITPTKVSEYGKLERQDAEHAKPASACAYPKCEGCREYVSYRGQNYCTVPMVLNKQIWRLTADLIAEMEKRLTELETLVMGEILRTDEPPKSDPANYTWDEYLGEGK